MIFTQSIKENRKQHIGDCPRIAIIPQIEAFLKNKHSHMFDISESSLTCFLLTFLRGKALIAFDDIANKEGASSPVK